MIQYGFVEGWQASCFGAIAKPSARFITHHLESVEMPITQPPLVDPELQRLSNVRRVHKCQAHTSKVYSSYQPSNTSTNPFFATKGKQGNITGSNKKIQDEECTWEASF